MTGRPFARFTFFLLELPRFAAVAALLSAFAAREGWPGSIGAAFAAPQALFVLAALLFWVDPERYAAYRPLYAAGKAVSAFALGAGLGASLPTLAEAVAMADPSAVLAASVAVPVLAYDFAAAAIVAYSCLKAFLRAGGTSAEDERPVLAVDEIPEDKGEA